MMRHCSCECLFRTAPGVHGDIPNPRSLKSVARAITPETQIDFAGASIDPDRLIAGQRARCPVRRITCNVGGRMHDKPAAAIGCRRDLLLLISDDVRVAMMPRRLMDSGPSIAAAECDNSRERDDGSHQHGFWPPSHAPSTENATGVSA